MGFFDRFKKNKDTKEQEQKQPLRLQYSDGTVADIFFNGQCEVEGKLLNSVNIQYLNQDGTFSGRTVLLEPITSYDEHGRPIDGTEQYYRAMAYRDGTLESHAAYAAVKGFFKKQEITEDKMGSNYIGNVSMNEKGQYYRYFDESFRKQHIERANAEKQAREEARVQREDAFMENLRQQIETKPVNIKTSHAEHLTQEKSPFQGR